MRITITLVRVCVRCLTPALQISGYTLAYSYFWADLALEVHRSTAFNLGLNRWSLTQVYALTVPNVWMYGDVWGEVLIHAVSCREPVV